MSEVRRETVGKISKPMAEAGRQDEDDDMTPLMAMILRALYWGYSWRKTRTRDTSLERRPPDSTWRKGGRWDSLQIRGSSQITTA